MFCSRTHSAVVAFQESYGIRASGEVDERTWSALIEASWSFGERLLYLRSPNIRGDDVAELQSRLNHLGFDCGRVDGIFGPRTVKALESFQENIGTTTTGICTPEIAAVLARMGSQSGTGPGVAVVRESVSLSEIIPHGESRLVVGYFSGLGALAHAVSRRIRDDHPLLSTVDTDASSQAAAANLLGADCYIGFESSPDAGCVFQYYEVPSFISAGGRNLAARLARAVADRVPELAVATRGLRHPVLRETRMPAVLCSMGPIDLVMMKQGPLSAAIRDAWEAWCHDPVTQL